MTEPAILCSSLLVPIPLLLKLISSPNTSYLLKVVPNIYEEYSLIQFSNTFRILELICDVCYQRWPTPNCILLSQTHLILLKRHYKQLPSPLMYFFILQPPKAYLSEEVFQLLKKTILNYFMPIAIAHLVPLKQVQTSLVKETFYY